MPGDQIQLRSRGYVQRSEGSKIEGAWKLERILKRVFSRTACFFLDGAGK